jgi:hypothetical protein
MLPFVAYLALAIASFYPQSLRPWDTVGYVGDSLESVYIIAWNVHQAFRSPTRIFDANILHPHERPLTFTDHQLLSSLSVAPVVWLTGNPVLAYNAAVLLASLLAAFAGRRLAMLLGVCPLGAWAAGALYAFHTYQVNEASRIQILFHGFLALAVGELLRFLATGDRRAAWTTAGLMLAQALCSNYHLLYGCVLIGLITLAFLAARPREIWRRLPALAAAGAVAALLYLPIGLPYVLSSRTHGYTRELPKGVDLQHYVSTSPTNLVYGPIGAKVKLQQQGPHFVGFVSMALAAAALFAWARRDSGTRGGEGPAHPPLLPARVWVPAAAALAALLVALSLGKDVSVFGRDLGPGPYRLLYYLVPGFQLMRIPERLSLLAMLFVGLLVGRAITLLRGAGWALAALVLAAAVPLEHLSPIRHLDRVPVGRDVPEVYRWLARNPVRALAEVPIHGEGLLRKESVEMYFSAYHFKPIIHGYASYPTQLNRLLRRLASQFPSETALQALQRVGVDTVVVHHGRQQGWDLYHQLRGPEREAHFRRLLPVAGLDVYERLPQAVAAGRIRLEARFDGRGGPLYESTADEVYRLLPTEPQPAAAFPEGRPLRDPSWRYAAKRGNPALAGDGDLETSWVHDDALWGDETFEIAFGRPVRVVGVVLPLRWDTVVPTRFVVEGLRADGSWSPLARFTRAQALQLLDQLLTRPREAAIGFAFPEREVASLRLAVEAGGTSFDGWSIPEIEVRGP